MQSTGELLLPPTWPTRVCAQSCFNFAALCCPVPVLTGRLQRGSSLCMYLAVLGATGVIFGVVCSHGVRLKSEMMFGPCFQRDFTLSGL